MLRNDGSAAVAVAHAVGARFVRINVLCGVRATDQGLISGRAHEVLRERSLLGAESIRILADVDEAEEALTSQQAEPRGELRVTAPVRFGELHVAPAVVPAHNALPKHGST